MKFKTEPSIVGFGESSLLLRWDAKPGLELLKYILLVKQRIKDSFQAEVSHTYNEVLVRFHDANFYLNSIIQQIKEIIEEVKFLSKASYTTYHLPVCYDTEFGWDIEEVCEVKKLEKEKLIDLHTKSKYLIYFIGFLPGFLYLEGLDEKLFIDRKKQPRRQIPKGAVGLAGSQTGIYPKVSPGGWQIIGNCPVELFNPKKSSPSIFSAGGVVKFFAVDVEEYQEIKKQSELGKYQLNCTTHEH